MMIDRKTFVRRVTMGAVTALVASSANAERPDAKLPAFSSAEPDQFWRAVRAKYPLHDDPLYLNTGGLGPTSQPALDAVVATMTRLQEHSETGHDLFDPARQKMARFLGAQPDEVCFTRNATEANSVIAAGLALVAGDEVIFDSHAHPGGSFPWLNQARQRGIVVKLFEPDPAGVEENVERIRTLVTDRTRVIQVSHITCTTGLVLPVRRLAEFTRERGIWLHVDGAQAVGMIPVDCHELNCDSYAVSGHKWLGGPHETGCLYIRRSQLEAVAPTGIGAYSGELAQLPGELTYRAAASRHEYGTRNAALISGLMAAVDLQEAIGRDRIAEHGRQLAKELIDDLRGVDGIDVLTPLVDDLRASIVTIRHRRADAAKFFNYLLKQHRLRCRPVTEQRLEAVRVSLHVFNSRADCARVASAVRSAATQL
jgi:selenocysteine lyase/cysteine desulfurase